MVYQARWLEAGKTFEVLPGEAVLNAALRQEVNLPHECRHGGCGTCRVKLTHGAVVYDEQPFGLSDEDAAQGYALLCQAQPKMDIEFSVDVAASVDPVAMTAFVHGLQEIGPNVINLSLKIQPGEPLKFLPGQYMNVKLPDGRQRSFSMASKPSADVVDFHIRRIPGGQFTDKALAALKVGDALSIEIPHGGFYYRTKDYRPMLMLATGTGLAPIKSILESLMDDEDCPPVSLYWGVRTQEDLYLHNEISSWVGKLYEFNYIPVLSRAGHGWTGRVGHVQSAVLDDHQDLSEHAIYLCGSPEMVSDAKRAVASMGANTDFIYSDSFFFNQDK